MTNDDDIKEGITRRDLFVGGAYAAAALSMPLILNPGTRAMGSSPKDNYTADLLIIGSGFAGTFAALEASKQGLNVTMVDKGTVGWSGMTPWASDSRPFDPELYDREEWQRNIAQNTEYLNDHKWLDMFIDESLEIFYTLDKMGAHKTHPFERGSKVFRKALEDAGVTLVERTMITGLTKDETGRVSGAVGFTYDDSNDESKAVVLSAHAVIMATGAGSYKSPGFPIWGLTFDGDAIAYEAGAKITGKEFNDTHGTKVNSPAASYENWTFAQNVTGAYVMVGPPSALVGGLTLNSALEIYNNGVDRSGRRGPPTGPGDGGGDNVVDPTGGPASGPEDRDGPPSGGAFPGETDPSQYMGRGFLTTPGLTFDADGPGGGNDRGYTVGGATAGMGVHKSEGVFCSDYSCAADGVEGLYAAGDALGSMLCGTSYPARGFSSYTSIIQGRVAAKHAIEYIKSTTPPSNSTASINAQIKKTWAPRENAQGYSPDWITATLQNTMTPFHIIYIKDARRLEGALASIEFLRNHCVPRMVAKDGHELRIAHEVSNMLLNAEMKLRASLYRKESRGTHYREDYPARNDREWHCWTTLQDNDGKMEFTKHPLPEEWKPDSSRTYRENYPRVFPGEDEYLASQGLSSSDRIS